MSRERKYRCWDNIGKKLHDVICIDFKQSIVTTSDGSILSAKNITIQNFVYNNGSQDIFVGDIVTGTKTCSDKTFVICERTDVEFIGYLPVEDFRYNEDNFPSSGKEPKFKGLSTFVRWSDLKVIGNIYENPDLLTN